MISPYVFRLICLSLACFFLVHVAAWLIVRLTGARVLRRVELMNPRVGANRLLAFALAPVTAAAVIVALLCIPSYLLLEPDAPDESVGVPCLLGAALACSILAGSMLRVRRALRRSAAYTDQLPVSPALLGGQQAWMVHSDKPVLALLGVFRPKLLVSRAVLHALSPEQLAAALHHEEAHARSRDNLKRLLLLAAPAALPFCKRMPELDETWSRLTERAADDAAAAKTPDGGVALAEALVRVARIGAVGQPPDLATAFVSETAELANRVDRLLLPPRIEPPIRFERMWLAAPALLLIGAASGRGLLAVVHSLLEHLAE